MLKKKLFYKLRKYSCLYFRDFVKWVLLAPCGILVRQGQLTAQESKGGRKNLVILRPDGIGDFVLFAREFHRYRKLYPVAQWKITLVGNKVWQALAEDLNAALSDRWFDEFLPVDRNALRRSFSYRRSIAIKLKCLSCDELIYPVHSRDVWGCVFSRWINAKKKIAPFGDTASLCLLFKLYFDRYFDQLKSESLNFQLEVDRADCFLRGLGDSTPLSSCFIGLPVTAKMAEEKEVALSIAGLRVVDPYMVLFPGASWPGKRWPVSRFVEWGKLKTKKNEIAVIVCGGPGEEKLGQTVADKIGENAHSLAGKTSLIGLAGLIAGAVECIGNDTAAVHLSAAFSRPTMCIMGGGHWGRFWPYGDLEVNQTISFPMPCFGCGWVCKYKSMPVPCIENAGRCLG